MKSSPEKLTKKHRELTHTEMAKVLSHQQRSHDEWFINTIMIEGCDTPFRYKRRKKYKNLKGLRVNLTYYPQTELVGGIEFEVMNVVRIKVA